MPAADPGDGLVAVHLIGLPIDVYAVASEHTDGLLREFALVRADPSSAPAKLLSLSNELNARFTGFTAAPQSALAEAIDGGAESVDLEYRLPPDAAEASIRLGDLLDEADAYCRREQLLTLESPPAVVAFRRWFLGEFVAQIRGGQPTSWPDWVEAEGRSGT